MQWQPIETAPREVEKEFLGWDGEQWNKTFVGYYDGPDPVFVLPNWGRWYPTHWMEVLPPDDAISRHIEPTEPWPRT